MGQSLVGLPFPARVFDDQAIGGAEKYKEALVDYLVATDPEVTKAAAALSDAREAHNKLVDGRAAGPGDA